MQIRVNKAIVEAQIRVAEEVAAKASRLAFGDRHGRRDAAFNETEINESVIIIV